MAVTSKTTGAGRALDERADWDQPETPPRDWKKLVLVVGLGVLSWVATYVGMLELIEANMGELPILHKAIIGFSVGMLMIMIVWLLDQVFAPIGWFTRLSYIAGYIFLTLISVGFGFGFYWKVLESRSESSRSAESAVGQVQGSLHAAATRLEQLQGTLEQLTQLSTQKAELERSSGTSCPASKPGDGPRRRLREDDAARFSFATEFVKGRVTAVRTDMGGLDTDLARIVRDDRSIVDAGSGTRNEFMKGLGRKLDMTVTGFNAFRTDPQLKQIRSDLAERADRTTFPDTKGGSFACPDPQLQAALKGVVRAIDQLPDLEKPKIAAVEGSEATIEAFRRLTATLFGLMSFKLPPSADELRQLQQKAVSSVEGAAAGQRAAIAEQPGLSKRDYIPLAIALFVDLCLLLVSMGRPTNRLQGLVPRMRAAERGPVYQILSKFSDIHKDEETREKFEVFRHVVFDFHGDYYVAVPLDAPYRPHRTNDGHMHRVYPRHVEDLQLEAHLLGNLFASFEKEKIFSRVYSPFLTTGTIQKKLARQGSKFAGSQAFRIYRFRDGAWSEIILGAIMGAARRTDAIKRQRAIAEGPILPGVAEAVADTMAEIRAAQDGQRTGAEPSRRRAGTADADPQHGASAHRLRPTPVRAAEPSPETLAKYGPYAAFNDEPATPADRRPSARPSDDYRRTADSLRVVNKAWNDVGEADVSLRPPAHANTNRPAQPAPGAERAGALPPSAMPQAWRHPEPLPENVVPMRPMPSAASAAPHASEPAWSMPRHVDAADVAREYRGGAKPSSTQLVPETSQWATHEPTVDVVIQRVTETVTVPVSEASLPPNIFDRMRRQPVVTSQAVLRADPTLAPTSHAAPAVLSLAAPLAATVEPARDDRTADQSWHQSLGAALEASAGEAVAAEDVAQHVVAQPVPAAPQAPADDDFVLPRAWRQPPAE